MALRWFEELNNTNLQDYITYEQLQTKQLQRAIHHSDNKGPSQRGRASSFLENTQKDMELLNSLLPGAKKKAAGATCDSMDLFIDLALLYLKDINDDVHTLFNLVYINIVPGII